MGTLLRLATPLPSRWSPSKRSWLSTSRQTFEFSSHQLLKKPQAWEVLRPPLTAPIAPEPPRAVRNGDEDSAKRNVTDNANHRQIAEPRGDRNQGHISSLYTNARSLVTKREELLAYVATEELDVIAITETSTNSSHLMAEFSTEGYESFHTTGSMKKEAGRSVTLKVRCLP